MMPSATQLLLALLPLQGLARAQVERQILSGSQTCSDLSGASFPVEYPANPDYANQQSQYWSAAASELLPACILVPQTPQDVVAIVKALESNSDQFAIKGGGHSANLNFSSISGGPLISMSGFSEVTYDSASETVRVGSGNRWEDVQAVLDKLNVTLVGGRIGHVGVGGYTLGGGMSFLTTQYGWAANNIVAAEMVLANGSFVTVSNETNPSLLKALKGGGNNFGIVTTYIFAAHPVGLIYGGTLSFPVLDDSTDDAILNAIYQFSSQYNDPKAAIIPTREVVMSPAASVWVIFLFYDGPSPPPGTFSMFESLGPAVSTVITQPYSQYLITNDAAIIKGYRYKMATETTPVPYAANSSAVMRAYLSRWLASTATLDLVSGLIGTIAFQPIPASAARQALARGGDLIDLDAGVDRIFWEIDYAYLLATDDDAVHRALLDVTAGLKTLVDSFAAEGAVPDAYRPLFMNDGYYPQDYFGRLRPESRQLAESVAKEVDPEGFFARRTDGFRP